MTVYLVTGGAGFIGSHLVEALLERGDQVRVLDDFSTGRRSNLDGPTDQIDLMTGSIADFETVRAAVQGVDYVLHHAAVSSVQHSIRDPLNAHTVNVVGTLNVLRAAKEAGVRRVIYAGSASAYGNQPADALHEGLAGQPLSPYAATKLSAELYCMMYAHTYGLETVIFRYFNVFGPRQDPASEYSSVIPLFVTRLIDDARPIIYGDGLQSRDFVYIQNVVNANLIACTAPTEQVSGQVFNIASGERTSLLQLLSAINQELGKAIEPDFRPARVGDIRHSRADIDKARRLLGYVPEIGFSDGLRLTVRAY